MSCRIKHLKIVGVLFCAEVKNVWSFASVLSYAFITCKRTTLPLLYSRSGQLAATLSCVYVIGNEHARCFVKCLLNLAAGIV
jgi:hypothetical protein